MCGIAGFMFGSSASMHEKARYISIPKFFTHGACEYVGDIDGSGFVRWLSWIGAGDEWWRRKRENSRPWG